MNHIAPATAPLALSSRAKLGVLLAAFGGLPFDGIELGLMPIASLRTRRVVSREPARPSSD